MYANYGIILFITGQHLICGGLCIFTFNIVMIVDLLQALNIFFKYCTFESGLLAAPFALCYVFGSFFYQFSDYVVCIM